MKKITSSLILLSVSFFAKSQVFFKNNTNEPVFAAIAYFTDTKELKCWTTVGWFQVIPGETKEVLSYNPFGEIYYFCSSKNKNYDGNTKFLVNANDAFLIKNADKKYVKEENKNYVFYDFRNCNRNGLEKAKLKYTIDFNY